LELLPREGLRLAGSQLQRGTPLRFGGDERRRRRRRRRRRIRRAASQRLANERWH